MKKAICSTCPHLCTLYEGEKGLCAARQAQDHKVVSINYGKVTSLELIDIEKIPLKKFHSGSKILSVGSFGCNFSCPFCHNHNIIKPVQDATFSADVSPKELADQAVRMSSDGNIGLAYTFNEPLIGWEYVLDCARLIKEHRLVNVVATNGFINHEPLVEVLPYIDAFNIDLKGFSEDFYRKLGGSLEPVKNTIREAQKRCHIEVSTLVIPNETDSEQEMSGLCEWLAGISKDIPLHITRFLPKYKYIGREATPASTIKNLVEVARTHLNYVYEAHNH